MKTLEEMARRHGTDKVEHGYCELYESTLGHLRSEAIAMLEVGVHKGASLLTWREFFPKAEIHAIDIVLSPGKMATEGVPGVHLHAVNCDYSTDISAFLRRGFEFDVIVDDGGHTMRQQQLALKLMWKSLKRGGVFIMEDLHTSIFAHYPAHNVDREPTTLELVEALESGGSFSSHYVSAEEFSSLKSDVASAKVWWTKVGNDIEVPSITSVIVKKG